MVAVFREGRSLGRCRDAKVGRGTCSDVPFLDPRLTAWPPARAAPRQSRSATIHTLGRWGR